MAPSLANLDAYAAPIPDPAPVIKQTLSFKRTGPPSL
jgi:hypothetical protein